MLEEQIKPHQKIHYSRHYVGIALLLLSLLPYWLPDEFKSGMILTLFFAFYCLGIALLSDYIAYKITGGSLLTRLMHRGKGRWYYFLIALIGGLILEGIATYLGGLWHYPFYSLSSYFIIAVMAGGFGWYFLCILLSYEAVKDILDKFTHGKKIITNSYRYEHGLYKILLLLGLLGLLYFVTVVLSNTNLFRTFNLDITNPKTPYVNFYHVLLAFVSIFFILEYIEYKRHRTSLIKDVLHGYINPLVAIMVSSVLLAFYMELQNVPIGLWYYTNWPLEYWALGNVPLVVFLVAWPIHYIFFLSLYRALGDSRSKEIWAGDKID